MKAQLKFPFPRPAPSDEDAPAPRVGEPLHNFGRPMDRGLPFRMPARAPAAEAKSDGNSDDVPSEVPEPPLSREQLRSRRARGVRARSISVKRLPKHELELGRALFPADEHADIVRPKTRADCSAVHRPCPFVSCVHHLYLDVSGRTGAIKMNFPDLEPDELPADASCAIDVAERDGETLQAVGNIMNITRERVRQVEVRALAKLEAVMGLRGLRDVVDGRPGQRGKRRLPIVQDDDVVTETEFDAGGFASEELDEE